MMRLDLAAHTPDDDADNTAVNLTIAFTAEEIRALGDDALDLGTHLLHTLQALVALRTGTGAESPDRWIDGVRGAAELGEAATVLQRAFIRSQRAAGGSLTLLAGTMDIPVPTAQSRRKAAERDADTAAAVWAETHPVTQDRPAAWEPVATHGNTTADEIAAARAAGWQTVKAKKLGRVGPGGIVLLHGVRVSVGPETATIYRETDGSLTLQRRDGHDTSISPTGTRTESYGPNRK